LVALPDTLTLAQANEAVRSIEQALAHGDGSGDVDRGALVIDASALKSFDTAAIAVLLQARRLAQAAGRALSVQGAPAAMVELSGLYGIAGLLGFPPTAPAGNHSARA
jgi:phospholipid transport system transporter-binding protein